ncbi:MAG: hypothetical protein ACP5QN_02935 [Minisyncoccia bacterium]
MKKIILFSILTIFTLSIVQISLAATNQNASSSLNFKRHPSSTMEQTTSSQIKTIKPYQKNYQKCLKDEVKSLTKEMQTKKKDALSIYKTNLKNSTSTTAKKEARKSYNLEIKNINQWFENEIKQSKTRCKTTTSTSTSTSTNQ